MGPLMEALMFTGPLWGGGWGWGLLGLMDGPWQQL